MAESLPVTLSPDMAVSLTLAGTVQVPAPFPAMAKVYIGKTGDGSTPTRKSAEMEPCISVGSLADLLYLKLVETFPGSRVTRRYVRAADVIAIRRSGDHRHEPDELLLGEALARELKDHEPTAGAEELLYERAVLYLLETAPVLVQIEFATTAGECQEQPVIYPPRGKCCG